VGGGEQVPRVVLSLEWAENKTKKLEGV